VNRKERAFTGIALAVIQTNTTDGEMNAKD
jgi:hypothetical protein